nr:membrane-spanning 4-domains subfamily A member 4D-like [Zootoca vivipara]XP_034980010.1 membrane-spanning 4-domains subfamily A member 4D-like [Zootoca vivipara]XP_034980019.1 membrane-spanning 4-domains subfamily A member 4D-like [Zootoca vivipara]XP_034980028.1 membrane-spanning 4-domains subfamily A member 4D-like [Zootoca vivipara]
MATDPVIKSNGTVVMIPSDGAIQAGQDFPGLQPAGTVQCIQNVGQQPGGSNNEQIQEDLLKKLRKIEIKTLGAIQVMLGLIYISLGTIVIVRFRRYYRLFTSVIGYPFWSGIFFIFSGSLSVAAEKYPSKALVISSVRMNIISAIMATIGIILYAMEIAMNDRRDYSDSEGFLLQSAGTALAVLLLLLSMLEFAITVSLAHLGLKAASNDMATTVLPQNGSPAEDNPEPVVYDEPTLDLLQKGNNLFQNL